MIELSTVVAYVGALAAWSTVTIMLANVDLFVFEQVKELDAVAAKLPNIDVH